MYKNKFQKALDNGDVIVRKAWINQNSFKDQMSVQFIQKIEKSTEGTANLLIGMAQGMGDLSKNLVTTIFSFKIDVAESLGLSEKDYFESDEVIKASDIFKTEVSIKVVENTTKNPLSMTQTPKINPVTGEVLEYKGKPIYRHTELVQGTLSKEDHVFLQHDNVVEEGISTKRIISIGEEPE